MVQDIEISKELRSKYDNHVDDSTKLCKSGTRFNGCCLLLIAMIVEFIPIVLTSGTWPFQQGPPINVADLFVTRADDFMKYYTHRHQGRKLTWLYHKSKCDLVMNARHRYTLQVSRRPVYHCW